MDGYLVSHETKKEPSGGSKVIGVPQARWMVYNRKSIENPIEMDDDSGTPNVRTPPYEIQHLHFLNGLV